ncbi:MAG: right-handed parallel beta-helix repeat-containing protein [Thermofilaceae archaeon]
MLKIYKAAGPFLILLYLGLFGISGGTNHQSIGEFSQVQERWTVCPEGPPQCPFTRIQEAIDAAPEGSLIKIGPGSYQENLQIEKTLSLVGTGPDQVVITPMPVSPDHPHVALRWRKAPLMVLIEGLSFLNIREERRSTYGISAGALAVILKNIKISGYPVGIHSGVSELRIEEATIERNGVGLWQVAGYATVVDSAIVDNETGIEGHSFMVSRSSISHNRVGIHVAFPSKAVSRGLPDPLWEGIIQHKVAILSNQIAENEIGILIGQSTPLPSYYPEGLGIVPDLLRVEDNRILNNQKYGVSLEGWQCLCTDERTSEDRLSCLILNGSVPSKILLPATEPKNEIQGSGQSDLCPSDYPWPPGFRK